MKSGDTVEGSVAHSIKTAVEGLDSTVGGTTIADGKHVAVEVTQKDGKLETLTVNEKDIASAATLTEVKLVQEANTALLADIPADKKVKGYVDEAVAAAKAAATKVVKDSAATHITVATASPAAEGSVTYTIGENDIASAAALNEVETAIAGAIDEDAQSITLGGKELKFVAFTATEIQNAAKPETSTPTEPNE